VDERKTFTRSKSHSRSETGMPTMSAIMCIGSWYATSWTKLHCSRSSARSTIALAHVRAWSSSFVIIRGVNPALTRRRIRV